MLACLVALKHACFALALICAEGASDPVILSHAQYAELKERVRQLEEELEAAAGANEALKHAQDLRVAKM